jgi:hypothetical protein
VNLFTRAALKRRNVPEDPTVPVDPGYSLSEYRVTGTYRERRAFDTNTELLVGFTAEQGVRTNFNFVRQAANIEALWHLTSRMSLSGRYALDFTELFDEQIQPEDSSRSIACFRRYGCRSSAPPSPGTRATAPSRRPAECSSVPTWKWR